MNPQTETIAPALFTISGASVYSGFARSRLYLEIKAGKLDARKAGRRTLITRGSLDAMLDTLPKVAQRPVLPCEGGR